MVWWKMEPKICLFSKCAIGAKRPASLKFILNNNMSQVCGFINHKENEWMKDLSGMVRKINFPFLPHRSSTCFQYVTICQTCNMNLSDPIQFFSVFRNHTSWNLYNTICKNSWDYVYFSIRGKFLLQDSLSWKWK